MDFRNRRAIHDRARSILSAAPGKPNTIALVYTLIISGMAILFAVITDLLSGRIANTGGLANMGLRSILSTAQTILPFLQLFITICLDFGYHRAVLNLARQQDASARTLLDGFRYFGPMLRAVLLQAFLYLSFGIFTLYAASIVFMMTPFAGPYNAIIGPALESASSLSGGLVLDEATMMAAVPTLIPMLWIWAGLFLLLFLPACYGFRMVNFCIADDPQAGALRALRKSKLLLRGNRFALFRLDLTLWWFYGLQFLITLVCYGEMFLPMLGISLPWSGTFSYYFFFALSLIIQIVAYYFLMNRANMTYGVAYEALQEQREAQDSRMPPAPNFPFPSEY